MEREFNGVTKHSNCNMFTSINNCGCCNNSKYRLRLNHLNTPSVNKAFVNLAHDMKIKLYCRKMNVDILSK